MISTPPSRTSGLAPVEVEEVAEAEAGHQDRVEDRVDVVGTDVGQAHGQDVGLALDDHALLAPRRWPW